MHLHCSYAPPCFSKITEQVLRDTCESARGSAPVFSLSGILRGALARTGGTEATAELSSLSSAVRSELVALSTVDGLVAPPNVPSLFWAAIDILRGKFFTDHLDRAHKIEKSFTNVGLVSALFLTVVGAEIVGGPGVTGEGLTVPDHVAETVYAALSLLSLAFFLVATVLSAVLIMAFGVVDEEEEGQAFLVHIGWTLVLPTRFMVLGIFAYVSRLCWVVLTNTVLWLGIIAIVSAALFALFTIWRVAHLIQAVYKVRTVCTMSQRAGTEDTWRAPRARPASSNGGAHSMAVSGPL